MQESRKIAIVGYSGHSFVVMESLALSGYSVIGYLEVKEVGYNPFNLDYLGVESEENIVKLSATTDFILGIGDNALRTKVGGKISSYGGSLMKVIHPSAICSESCTIGEGTFTSAGVVINAYATIGKYGIINTGAVVEHECQIGEGVHIAPRAVLLGNVRVGNNSFVGAGSVIKQGVTIANDVVIGAGSVVLRDIRESGTFVGNPARKI